MDAAASMQEDWASLLAASQDLVSQVRGFGA